MNIRMHFIIKSDLDSEQDEATDVVPSEKETVIETEADITKVDHQDDDKVDKYFIFSYYNCFPKFIIRIFTCLTKFLKSHTYVHIDEIRIDIIIHN